MRSILACLCVIFYAIGVQAQPQSFSSGSTGADGPLTYADNLGLVYFPPVGLSPRTNNIYNFTTITIGDGTTVRVSGWVINTPLYWLAQSDVTISGTLDISGQAGHAPNNPSYRAPSEPGAGGYSGGVAHLGAGQNATAGNGPGGGAAPGYDPVAPDGGGGGTYTGSSYLQPLIGGSGGGGGCRPVTTNSCAGGGAGGGAILIASSTKIAITSTGRVNAMGGNVASNYGGGGSGGAVRLVSNTVTNAGSQIHMCGGRPGSGSRGEGGGGVIRFEGFNITGANQTGCPNGGNQGTLLASIPYNLALPIGGPSVLNVTSVNGVSVNANPFVFPDVTINTGSPVQVVISGTNIPSGTTGNLYIFSENSPDQAIPFTLTGTLASTTATVSVPYPSGGSRGFAKAVWTQ
jgi:hypothetical protein